MGLYYVDELAADLWASLDADLDAGHRSGDGRTAPSIRTPAARSRWATSWCSTTRRRIRTSDTCARTSARRSSGLAAPAMWCPTGNFQFQRAYPGVDPG